MDYELWSTLQISAQYAQQDDKQNDRVSADKSQPRSLLQEDGSQDTKNHVRCLEPDCLPLNYSRYLYMHEPMMSIYSCPRHSVAALMNAL